MKAVVYNVNFPTNADIKRVEEEITQSSRYILVCRCYPRQNQIIIRYKMNTPEDVLEKFIKYIHQSGFIVEDFIDYSETVPTSIYNKI